MSNVDKLVEQSVRGDIARKLAVIKRTKNQDTLKRYVEDVQSLIEFVGGHETLSGNAKESYHELSHLFASTSEVLSEVEAKSSEDIESINDSENSEELENVSSDSNEDYDANKESNSFKEAVNELSGLFEE